MNLAVTYFLAALVARGWLVDENIVNHVVYVIELKHQIVELFTKTCSCLHHLINIKLIPHNSKCCYGQYVKLLYRKLDVYIR